MAQKISRREFTKKAAGVAAGLAASKTLMAQNPADKQPPVSDAEMGAVQKQLAKPMSDDAKTILRADLSSQKQDTLNRLKVNLPENSEPCFVFSVTPKANKEDN